MRSALAGLAVLAWLAAPAGLAAPATAQEARLEGSVKGRARARAPDMTDPENYKLLRDAKLFDYSRLENVVVYAEPLGSTASARSAEPLALALEPGRRGASFSPSFLALPAGGEVALRNAAEGPALVYSGGGSPGPLRLDLAPGGEGRLRPPEPGLYRLYCLEHPKAEARLLVAGPYLARPDRKGAYALALPAGRYRVTAWHERLPPRSVEVELGPGERLRRDFELTVADLPAVP